LYPFVKRKRKKKKEKKKENTKEMHCGKSPKVMGVSHWETLSLLLHLLVINDIIKYSVASNINAFYSRFTKQGKLA